MAQLEGIHEKSASLDWTLIAHLTIKSQMVNVHFKIMKKGKPRIVTQRMTGRKFEIVDCVVGDKTGIINLTLWNEDIEAVEEGKTYTLLYGVITEYDECISLTRGRRGEFIESLLPIEEVNEQVDMSRPFMGKPQRKKRLRSPTGRSFQGTAGRESKGYCSQKGF